MADDRGKVTVCTRHGRPGPGSDSTFLPPLLSPGVSGLAAMDLELEMGADIDNWGNPDWLKYN